MRKSRFSETQIVSILKEHDAGATFVELGRQHGVHPNTIAAWKAKYGGTESSELARSRAIEEENARMRRIIANLSLENDAMKELISKTSLGPSQRKDAVRALQELGLSQRAVAPSEFVVTSALRHTLPESLLNNREQAYIAKSIGENQNLDTMGMFVVAA